MESPQRAETLRVLVSLFCILAFIVTGIHWVAVFCLSFKEVNT